MRLSYSGLVCLPSKEDTVSSNLISRSTVNAFTKSFLLQLILDTRIGYLGSFFLLYWKFSPYTSIDTSAWYARPDGDFGIIYVTHYDSYGCTISPSTEHIYGDYAYFVFPSGDLNSSVRVSSYGHINFIL